MESDSEGGVVPDTGKDQHIVSLILYKHEAQKRIEALETALQRLKPSLMDGTIAEMVEKTKRAHPHFTLDASSAGGEEDAVAQVTMWNNELLEVVEKLQKTLQRVESEANAKLSTITSEMESLVYENATLMRENESLKERVADDVLRKRLANRIEVAAEKAKIAALVRSAGLRRLEYMEGNLMEAHDDMYHRQRHDAVDMPRRDLCFVFQYVSNLTYPLRDAEEVTMNVCRQIMANSQRQRGGHRVGSYRGMEVYVFQDPMLALDFAQHCHMQLLQFRHHEREDLPHFSAVYEQGVLVYRGPRLHTCLYSCTPEVEVDPVSGQSVYFGPDVRAAVSAALQYSGVGEIAVNKTWATLFCRRYCYMTDSNAPVKTMDLRDTLGKEWDVMEMPGAGGLVYSLLPSKLRGRRSVDPNMLLPSPKYPCMDVELQDGVNGIVKALKHTGGGASKHKQHIWASAELALQDGDLPDDDISGPMRMLEYFTLKQEKDSVSALYNDLQRSSEYFERDMMAKEDRYEISNRSPLDPSETVFVCTVDFGDDAFWKQIVVSTMTAQEYNTLRDSIRGYIHARAKLYCGFLMNGNYVDIFTYVFRGVEAAFSFVSDVYIMVNRTGTKCSHATQGSGQDVFFLRAGVTSGPMSSIYRVKDAKGTGDSVKCTGAQIRLSGTLCDLSQNGEILATEDVIDTFLSANENLLDAQFNIVRQRGQYIGGSAIPTAVHSILPKPFAYRRKQMRAEKEGRRPSRSAASALEAQRTEYSKIMVEQLMVQQRERLEVVEASLMAAQDKPELCAREIRNPWFITMQSTVTPQPYGTHPNYKPPIKPLAFFYCDILGSVALEMELPPPVLQKMYSHYNYIVQSAIQQAGGFVSKTNSVAGYMVIFSTVFKALEAATSIQERLHSSAWPEEMKTKEQCLYVRHAKTGDVIFNGPRAKIAVHVSNQYTWKRSGTDHSVVEFSGLALEELFSIGHHAHGGEIRFSRQCTDYLKSTSATLLLEQLVVEVLPSLHPNPARRGSASSLTHKAPDAAPRRRRSSAAKSIPQVAVDCVTAVPRSIEGRMPYMLPGGHWLRSPHTPGDAAASSFMSSMASEIPKLVPSPPLAPQQMGWFLGHEGSVAPLPVAIEVDPAGEKERCAESREVQLLAERALSKFPSFAEDAQQQVIKSWSSLDSSYSNFMRHAKELVHHLVKALTFCNDKVKPPPLPKLAVPKSKSAPLPPAPGRGGSRIPTAPAPPATVKTKKDRDVYDDALDYLDESCKFLSKLKGMQT